MNQRQELAVRQFHVVGGGCFGTQYVRWLLRARSLGWLKFESIQVIDHDPDCLLQREGLVSPSVRLVRSDWVDYFSNYLVKNFRNPDAHEDHWVPSHMAPHILFLSFIQGATSLQEKWVFDQEPFQEEVSVPVQIPLKMGTFAVSYAQWQCPANCIEPPNCPAIHKKRDWDMKLALENYFAEQPDRSSHVLQCQHLLHGVGTIPCGTIFSEFSQLLDNLAGEEPSEVLVATVSGCHGLIGRALVLMEPA